MSVVQPQGPSSPGSPWRQLRRNAYVVVLVLLVCLGVAAYRSFGVATTWTARASLIVSSPDRAPEQDSVLVTGYGAYFNNDAYQERLLEQVGVDEPVTLLARVSGSSPILLVEATAQDPDLARQAADAVSSEFMADINREMDATRDAQVADLQDRVEEAVSTGVDTTLLQDQLAELQQDTTNRLQELQLDAGVTRNAPSPVTNLVLGVGGGLLAGSLLAVTVGRLRERRQS